MRKAFWKGVMWVVEPLLDLLDHRKALRNADARRAAAIKQT